MSLVNIKWLWCLLITVWAVVTDVKFHKIKNHTVSIGIVGGLLLNCTQLKPALLGLAVPLLLIVLFAIHFMGAGDIKLLCALGATLCFPKIVSLILYSFVFCGIHIFVRAWRQHGVSKLFLNLWQDFLLLLWTRRFRSDYTANEKLPMAGSIAAAVLFLLAHQIF